MTIPTDYLEFLHWFKQKTEQNWNDKSRLNPDWIIGAKWQGLEENQIEDIEDKYEISFTHEHKDFLRILHAIDKKQPQEYYDEDDNLCIENTPYFYNWLIDDEEIKGYLEWPYEQILYDVKKNAWLPSWGVRPESVADRERIFSKWYDKAPKIIPIHAHRFVVGLSDSTSAPVLSVWGTDTIVYGWNIKQYLMYELEEFLDISKPIFDEKENYLRREPIQELAQYNDRLWTDSKIHDIPYWSEMIEFGH